MGGGGDSRIPSILKEIFSDNATCGLSPYSLEYKLLTDNAALCTTASGARSRCLSVNVVVRTYDFDPEVAAAQIDSWVRELRPALVVGESLGAVQAIRVKGVPHILVSPSLGAPLYFGHLAFLALIPGVTALLDHIYKPKPGDRQKLHFDFRTMRKYLLHRRIALLNSPLMGGKDRFFAFFGAKDHYRKTGVVSVRLYRKYFGSTYALYRGTHFMEEDFVRTLLADKIREFLAL